MCTDDMKVDMKLPRRTKKINERGSGKKVKGVLGYMKRNIFTVYYTIYMNENGLMKPI